MMTSPDNGSSAASGSREARIDAIFQKERARSVAFEMAELSDYIDELCAERDAARDRCARLAEGLQPLPPLVARLDGLHTEDCSCVWCDIRAAVRRAAAALAPAGAEAPGRGEEKSRGAGK